MAAAVVYWPRSARGAIGADLLHGTTVNKYALVGFRVNERTFCIVELLPDDHDLQDRVKKSASVEVIGEAVVVSAEQHDTRIGLSKESAQTKPVNDGLKQDRKDIHLRAHLVVPVNEKRRRLMNWMTNRGKTLSSSTPAVVYVDGGADDDQQRDPSSAIRHCNVVFYDAQIAAKGCLARCARTLSNGSAFKAPLAQIDSYFVKRFEQDQALKRNKTLLTRSGLHGLFEFIGFYSIFLPSTLLMRVSTAVNDGVAAKLPASLPGVGGKSAKDGFRFLELLSSRLHTLARFPSVVRNHYLLSKSRRTTDEEVAEVIEAWNYGCYVAMDAVVGRLLTGFVFQILVAHLQTRELSPEAFLEILRSNVVWLMGAPAGFKQHLTLLLFSCMNQLNAPLASILGNGILLWLDLWEYALSLLIGSDAPWSGILQSSWTTEALSFCWRNMGATLQLTLLADTLMFFTWNSYWVYQYFTKLNMLQFGLFSSLWKLFLGKKNNVLRKRVDSCEYDVSQLLLGTLLFTILFFIVTTNMVFFVYFGLVRLSIFVMQAALWFPVVCLRAIPVASLLYRWWNPTFFIAGVQLEARNELTPPTKTLDIHDVGVGKKRQSDAEAQQRIRKVTACGIHNDDRELVRGPRNAYFQLVPVASSASSLLSRLRHYIKALSTHYSLGAVLRSWFFGSHISPIPLAILFDSPAAHASDNNGSASSVAISSSTASRPISPSTKKNL